MTEKNGKDKKVEKKSPREIVNAVYFYLKAVIPENQKIAEPRVEQLEPVEKEDFWKVVLSYDVIGDFAFDKKREYKEFKVHGLTAEVVSMKIFDKPKG